MNTRNKAPILLAMALVGLVTLACACPAISSLVATPTPLPAPTRTPFPTTAPEPMSGLVGVWRDTAEGTEHTIMWGGNSYIVTRSVNDDGSINDITSQVWNGSTFTFDYYV